MIGAALALATLPLLATFAPPDLFVQPEPPAKTALTFEAVPLDRDKPERRSVGKLLYLGGWQIRSNDPRFGGISAMHVDRDEVTAVSDAGSLIRFSLPGGSLAPSIAPLSQGSESAEKSERDSEAMVVHGRRAWIGFERRNIVRRYRRGSWTSDASAAPAGMKSWAGNSGGEAMLRLPGGEFLIFSEGKPKRGGGTEALLFEGDPTLAGTRSRSLSYLPPEGYRITDAALLPDGRILFLNRRFSIPAGFTAQLTISPKPIPGEGGTLSGEEIAHLERPISVDNMEALSVSQESGRTIVWLASDDNLNPLQRTLLLKFVLSE